MRELSKSKKQVIDRVNHRIARIKKIFSDQELYTALKDTISHVEGIELTTNGNISMKSKVDALSLASLDALVQTPREIIKDTLTKKIDLMLEPYDSNATFTTSKNRGSVTINIYDDGDLVKSSTIEEQSLIDEANLQALEESSYNAMLSVFYTLEPSDITSIESVDYSDIQRAMQHSGRELTEEEYEKNRTMIKEYIQTHRR